MLLCDQKRRPEGLKRSLQNGVRMVKRGNYCDVDRRIAESFFHILHIFFEGSRAAYLIR